MALPTWGGAGAGPSGYKGAPLNTVGPGSFASTKGGSTVPTSLLLDLTETPAQRAERERAAEQQRLAQMRADFDREQAAAQARQIEAQRQASGVYTQPAYRYAGQAIAAATGSNTTTPSTTAALEIPTIQPVRSIYSQAAPMQTVIPGQTAADLVAARRAGLAIRRRGFSTGLSIPAA